MGEIRLLRELPARGYPSSPRQRGVPGLLSEDRLEAKVLWNACEEARRYYSDIQDFTGLDDPDIVELPTWWKDSDLTYLEEAASNHELLLVEEALGDYAEDLARDIEPYRYDRWPLNCIDWERAAGEMRQDLTTIEIYGYTFFYRS